MKPAHKKQILRVVSYNVHFGANTSEIAKVFKQHPNLSKADVILFQEIEDHPPEKTSRAEKIAKKLGFHFFYEPARSLKNAGTHGLATLSKYPIKNTLSIKLPEYKIFFLTQSRIALVTTLKIKGIDVAVCNIHLDTRLNPKKRIAQLKTCLLTIKKNYKKNIIIGGDFNTIPVRVAAGLIPIFYSNQAKRIKKYMFQMGFKHFCSPVGPSMKRGLIKMKLDHIYTDDLPIVDCGIEKDVYLSDHKPLWADIELA